MHKNSVKVSIIVPVYNAERYLCECVDSILAQSFSEIEVILIDDGSRDGSYLLCEKYSNMDKRVICVKVKNGGVSKARNRGIALARGEYIMFVDSDDTIEKNAVEKLYLSINNRKNIALVACGYTRFYRNKKDVVVLENTTSEYNTKKSIEALFNNEVLGGFVANKLYKKEIIDKGACFDETLRCCEDLKFLIDYLTISQGNVRFIKKSLYNYRMRSTSALNSSREKKNSPLDAYDAILKDYPELDSFIRPNYIIAQYKFNKKDKSMNGSRQGYLSFLFEKNLSIYKKAMCLYFIIVPTKIDAIFKRFRAKNKGYFL